MKLRVVGWVYYDEDLEHGRGGWAARHAIVDEIKRKGYMFSGWAHQKGYRCAPVLNDGKIYCYSQRSWGSIMAEAHGYRGRMDYARFAFMTDPDKEKRPGDEFDEDSFLPELNLNEKFELKVSDGALEAVRGVGKIKLDDLPYLRYRDEGDTLALTSGTRTQEFKVIDVDRERDISEKRLFELECAMDNYDDKEARERAEEEYRNAKIVMIIKLKPVEGNK